MPLERIPSELRQWPQWVCWRYEDRGGAKPTKVPYNPVSGLGASHSDPLTWNAFDICAQAFTRGMYQGVGFVLSERDPYTFIDLDDTHDDEEASTRQQRIFESFNSYSEKSPSGKGLHIIVKGSVLSGRKRALVEVYSSHRFMTMTGDVYHDSPIMERQALLSELWEQMGGIQPEVNYAGDPFEREPDNVIVQRAMSAANGIKFTELLNGHWQHHYASQSEADFAFVDIIAFYTQHKEQIVRIFRKSALGQRIKAQRTDYVEYMLKRAFDRMLPPIDFDGLKNKLEQAIVESKNPFEPRIETIPQPGLHPNHTGIPTYEGVPLRRPQNDAQRKLSNRERTYDRPAGLLGDLAQFIYAQAPRPVPEIALTGAIALMAAICGRAYNVSGMGLNQYVLLLAPTGTGKEAIASGIDKIMAHVRKQVPAASEFIGPSEIASAEALFKYMHSTSSSFVSMMGEFGLKLRQMASVHAPPHLVGLRRAILDLFNKSGEGKLLHPIIYSDKAKNTEVINAPAFSLMGESTPERFYSALAEDMISEGLLPRFTMIEYYGLRPPLNEEHSQAEPTIQLVTSLAQLCGHALQLNQHNKAIQVQQAPQAAKLFKDLDKYADSRINGSDKDVVHQLWNRVHVKALKLAALLAVGDNAFQPTISEAAANWAINLVLEDTKNLLQRFESGAIGGAESMDTKQLDDLARLVSDYMVAPADELEKYGVALALHQNRVIPYAYLSRRAISMASFRLDRLGATNALKKAIQAMTERGDIQELARSDISAKFKTNGRCFMVSNAAAFFAKPAKSEN